MLQPIISDTWDVYSNLRDLNSLKNSAKSFLAIKALGRHLFLFLLFTAKGGAKIKVSNALESLSDADLVACNHQMTSKTPDLASVKKRLNEKENYPSDVTFTGFPNSIKPLHKT